MLGTHQGSCHCGTVQFEVLTDPDHAVVCDCSICRRRGTVMLRCDETALHITAGADNLACYQFNTQVAQHYFCKTCGIYVFHKMRKLPDKYGINAGCLHDIDPHALTPTLVQGSKR
jgi:hypothetical protein